MWPHFHAVESVRDKKADNVSRCVAYRKDRPGMGEWGTIELDPDMDTQISFVCKLLCYIVQHGPYVWWVQNANIYCVYISIHPFRKQLFKNCLLIEVSFLSGCEFCLPVCETRWDLLFTSGVSLPPCHALKLCIAHLAMDNPYINNARKVAYLLHICCTPPESCSPNE